MKTDFVLLGECIHNPASWSHVSKQNKKTHQTNPKREKKAQPIFSEFYSDFWSDYCFLIHYTFISYFQDRVLLTLTVLNENDPGRTWKLRYPKEEQREVVSEPLNLICHIQPMCSGFPVLLIHLVVCASGTRAAFTQMTEATTTVQFSSTERLGLPEEKSGNQGGKGRNSRSTYQSAERLQQFSFQPL